MKADRHIALLFPFADPRATPAALSAAAAEVVDWRAFLERATSHGLLPLFNRWVATTRPAMVPPEIAREATLRAQISALTSLRITGELISLSRILEAAGVPVLALKGPALAARAYGDVALRPQADLDLLIHQRDIDRALTALAPAGYARVTALAAGQESAYREVEYHHPLAGASGISVELHWGIIKKQFGLRVPDTFWWTDPHLVPLGGTAVKSLSNEATLVYLAIHGAKHEWRHLRWIGDIAGVARLEPMDWGLVREMSVKFGTLRMTRLAVALARELLGAELPERAVSLAAGDSALAPLIEQVRARLSTDELPGPVESTRFQLGVRERIRDRVAFAVGHAVTPNVDDLGMAELPVGWRWVYLGLRPVRLARKLIGMPFQRRG